MSVEKEKISKEEEDLISLQEKDVIIDNNDIKIEEATIDQLIDIIKSFTNHNNPISISKKAELVKALFYKKLNGSSDKIENENVDTKEEIFKEFFNEYRKQKNNFRKEVEKKESENLEIKKEIINEIKELTSEVELEKNTFKKFRSLQKKWNNTGYVSLSQKNEIWQMYNHYTEVFYDYLKLNKDLRDIDFKKNLDQKTKICIRAEKLKSLKSLNEMHTRLQDLHEEWKNTGPVNKESRDGIWIRFQEASRKINKKRNDHFLEIKKNDAKKIENKNNICFEIDKLSKQEFKSHKECLQAIEQFDLLSKKWKSHGRVSIKENKKCWQKFQLSVNSFYNNKNNFYKSRKENLKNIIEEKSRLCEEAEKITKNQDWNTTSKKYIKLQQDWKKTGFIKGKINDNLWKKFKKSCDNFFHARKEFYKESDKEKKKNLKAKTDILLLISKFKKSKKPLDDIQFIKDKCEQWNKLEKSPNSFQIDKEFKLACKKVVSNLDLEKQEIENEKFLIHTTLIKNNKDQVNKEKSIIKEKIDDKNKEIILFENNKSFFVGNKGKNPLLEQIENNISNLFEEITLLKNKLKILNRI